MRNQGFELDLNIDIISSSNFNYSIDLVGSVTANKFISFSNNTYTGQTYYWMSGFPAPGSPGSVQRIEEGKRVGTFYTYKYAGVDNSGNWLVFNKDGEEISIVNAVDEDMQAVGNGMPKLMMSWNNSLYTETLT